MCRTKVIPASYFQAEDEHEVSSASGSDSQPAARRREIKPWNIIQLPSDIFNLPRFPEGFSFDVYDGHLTQHFEVPSQDVIPTHGSVRYVEHFNECGPYSRFRFQICHNFTTGRCNKGGSCTYIHVAALPQSSVIHVQGCADYEMLPPGATFFLHSPHSKATPQMVRSEYLIQTQGSLLLMESIMGGKQSPIQRPQHCAHFQYKRVCNRGYNCNFIHSIIPAPR